MGARRMLQATSKGWSCVHEPSELEVPYALHGCLERHQRLQLKLSRMLHKRPAIAWHGPQECRVARKGGACFQMSICTESITNSLNFNELTQYMCSAQDRCDQLQNERVAFNGNGDMDGSNPVFLTQEGRSRTLVFHV